TVEEYGDPDGTPVVLLHATPGCRFGVVPREVVAAHPRMRFIAYDRPGYGDADRLPGRHVADAARDVRSRPAPSGSAASRCSAIPACPAPPDWTGSAHHRTRPRHDHGEPPHGRCVRGSTGVPAAMRAVAG
ncbi:hypothetical protein ABZ235_30875, partial [Streptomyces canus]|uniref:alpha/beta fold hydrolase n=1 Tax=Streptomyces canus TaxID=58343 RepID=UPI00348584AA